MVLNVSVLIIFSLKSRLLTGSWVGIWNGLGGLFRARLQATGAERVGTEADLGLAGEQRWLACVRPPSAALVRPLCCANVFSDSSGCTWARLPSCLGDEPNLKGAVSSRTRTDRRTCFHGLSAYGPGQVLARQVRPALRVGFVL